MPISDLFLPSQMSRSIGQDDLERGPDRTREKMAATRGAIGQAKDDVNVKTRLAVVADGDVADRA
jgi:hypothetical protein